jgi:hypothetical protein
MHHNPPSVISKQIISFDSPACHRAGYISLFLTIACTLWFHGISGYTEAFGFMTSSAICLVLMLQALADLAIHGFSQISKVVGRSVQINSFDSPASHRAGYISLFLTIACTLWFHGISGYTEAFGFMTLSALCLVFMLQALADLAIHGLSQFSKGVGRSVGIAFRLWRSS